MGNRENVRAGGKARARGRSGQPFAAEDPRRDWSFADRLGDMISAHAPDGTYLYVSGACRELLGYEPEDLVGVWCYDFFHPDDVPEVGIAHRSALGGAPFTIVYRLRRKDGEYVWVETTNRVVTDPSGEVLEIVACTRPTSSRPGEEPDGEALRSKRVRINGILANEAISSVFQPIRELASGRVVAYEALSRFPGNSGHSPNRWFEDAWEVGLGIALELLAARKAAAALPRLPSGIRLAINASPQAAGAEGFRACLGGEESRVTVEITEHLRIEDYERVRTALASLRAAGCGVAVDDFGAGFASLRHILEVAPEWIKLDHSLTRRMVDDENAAALVAALASVAGEVESRVVAEGIESERQLEALRRAGIEYGQGFHLGRPAPLEEALERS